MATSKITKYQDPIQYSSGSVTAASGASVSEVKVRQYGKVVWVNFYVTTTNAVTSETSVATLSGVSMPEYSMRFVVGCGDNAWSANKGCYCYFGTDGVFKVTPISSAKVFTIQLSYITA